MHILLTRSLEDCTEMILKFRSLGHQVSHLPLLSIDKVDYDEINFSNYKGVIFTSANAIKYLYPKKVEKKNYVFLCWKVHRKESKKRWFPKCSYSRWKC